MASCRGCGRRLPWTKYAGEEMPPVIDAWGGAPLAHRYGKKIRREVDRIQRSKFKKSKPSKRGTKR